MSGRRIMFHVQHLLGIGHQMRAAANILAMQALGLDVVCVSGGEPGAMPDLGGAASIQLPPVRAADASFRVLLDETGHEIDDAWRERRRAALLEAFREARPDMLVIETFPFGRWKLRFELIPLLEAARAARIPAAVSVRDILVEKKDPKRLAAIVDVLREFFAAVLVHGDSSLVPFGKTFAPAEEIADLIRYTGYVAPPAPGPSSPDGPGAGAVIVAAGGGAVGGALLRAALAARPLTRLADAPWRLITGPNLPAAERAALDRIVIDRAHDQSRESARHVKARPGSPGLKPPPGVVIETLRDDYREVLARAAVSVSQAGYNTVMDILVTGARSVLVPFGADSQTEQELRASLLAGRGRAQMVREAELTAETLAAAIDRAASDPPPDRIELALDGARRTAEIVAELAGAHRVDA